MWHRQGKINVTKGSDVVTGTNTGWVENIRVGDAFQGPDGKLYQVINVASNEALAISPAYEGNSATGLNYWIVPIPGYNKVQADRLSLVISKLDGDIVNATEAAEQAVSAAQQAQQWRNEAVNSAAAALASEQHAESLVDDALSSKQAAELAAARSEAARDQSETAADGIRGVFDSVSLKAGEAADSAANAENSAAAAALSESKAKTSELAAQGASANAQSDAALAQASKNLAVTAAQVAEQARDDAVAVTTGGNATLDPKPGKIPLARATGAIDQGWVHGLEYELDQLRLLRNQVRYGDGPYPVLDFQFAGARYLDPRIEFTRASLDWDDQGNEYAMDQPVLTDKGLGLSGLRGNYALYSEDLTESVWVKKDIEVVELKTVDGMQFSKITPNSNTTWHYARQSVSLPEGEQSYQFKIIKDGIRYFRFSFLNTSGTQSHFYADLDELTVTPNNEVSSYSITEERGVIEIKLTVEGVANNRLDFIPTLHPNTVTMTGNGVDGTWIGGFMAESSPINTAYIPTKGSQVMVAASFAQIDVDISDGYTVFFSGHINKSMAQNGRYIWSLGNGVSTGAPFVGLRVNQSGSIALITSSGSSTAFITDSEFINIAVSVESKSAKVFANGGEVAAFEMSSDISPERLFKAEIFGIAMAERWAATGRCRVFSIYDHPLTPAQLQELTQ